MKKMIFAVVFLLLAGRGSVFGQSDIVQEHDYERFNAVNVSDYFSVNLYASDRYSVKIVSDERIAPYVKAYVKNGTLFLELDEKGYTPELKKALRAKGAAEPNLKAEVYMPTLNSLVLKEKSVITRSEGLKSENFTLTATDNSRIEKLPLQCVSAEVNLSKGAVAFINVNASKTLYLDISNSSEANIRQESGSMDAKIAGSAVLKTNVNVSEMNIDIAGGTEAYLTGTASMLKVKAAGLSVTDAEALEVSDAEMEQTGSSKCYVNVVNNLKVNLTGGCLLSFKRNPSIEVDRIVNSTMIKADDPKRKK